MRNVLATIVTDGYQGIHQYTGPRMEAYAEMIEADYIVLRETSRKPPHFAKYDLLISLGVSGYEQGLFVDADVYIREQAPNIFDFYKSAAFSEIPHPRPSWLHGSIDWIRHNLVPDWPADRYFNTGVMVLDGQNLHDLAIILKNSVPMSGIFYEQEQLNVLMRDVQFPRERLNQKWNQMCADIWITEEKARESYFLHATGYDVAHKTKVLAQFSRDYP